MPWNTFKPRGAAKGNEPTSGSAVIQSTPKFGVVKDNIDPLRCGRIRVYVEGMSGLNPDDADSWITVQYMSTFYGQTLSTSPKTGYGDFKTNTHSYGFWAPAPDIGTTVVLLFINGDPNYGVWIGAVPEPAALQMVPAVGAAIPGVEVVPNSGEAQSLGGASRLPAVNVNTNNTDTMSSPKFLFEPRPVHSYAAAILFQQGLIRDPLRGVVGSSAQRETPSRVTGISTPGRPIYSGGYTDASIAKIVTDTKTPPESLKVISRRGGHSLVMDDGDLIGRDQMVRLRTALGHQILMSDDGQCLFIIHSNGKSWIELGKEGTIDMYSTNSVNIRTCGDLNLHADRDINMQAGRAINAAAESIAVQSTKNTTVRTGGDWTQQTVGRYTVKVGGAMSMASGGEGSYYSSATMYINGSIINLNSGSASTTPGTVNPLPVIAHTDTLFDTTSGWLAAPGKLLSIVSRAPAHTPWDSAGSGVSVKVELNSAAALPAAPAAAVAAQSAAAAANTPTPAGATAATAKTVPSTGAVSRAIDSATTAAAVSARAAAVANSPAAAAAAVGAGVVEVAGRKTLVVGQTGLTAPELVRAGMMPPGSDVLVDGLANRGVSVDKILGPGLMSGTTDARALASNAATQTAVLVTNMQGAQQALQQAGAITGRENGGAILGTVLSAATNGVAATVGALKNTVATAAGAVVGAAGRMLGGINAVTNLGNSAAAVVNGIGGSVAALGASVGALTANLGKTASNLIDTARGAAASAFNAIKSALPTLKAGVPQDVGAIAASAAAAAQGGSTALPTPSTGVPGLGDAIASVAGANANAQRLLQGATDTARAIASGAAGSPVGSLLALTGTATAAVTNATATINAVAGTVNKTGLSASPLTAAGSGVASGLNLLPGGMMPSSTTLPGLAATVGGLTAPLNTGLSAITGAVAGAKSAITGLSTQLDGAVKLAGNPASLAGPALLSVTGSVGNLKSQINSAGGGLKDLALVGLSPAAAGQLRSTIASLSTGDITVSLPSTAINTGDWGAVADSAVESITGPGISPPNFNGNPATLGTSAAAQLIDNIIKQNTKVTAAATSLSDSSATVAAALQNHSTVSATLPEGAPQIAAAKAALDTATGTGLRLQQDAKNLLGNVAATVGSVSRFPRL